MKKIISFLFLILFLGAASCQHDDAPQVYDKGTDQYTKKWMYEQMQRYYYWNNDLPDKGNLSVLPKEYYNYLLSPNDRFSYAVNLADAETFPKSVKSSFGFDVSFFEYNGRVFGVVVYVLSNSPAKYAGLQRGQLVGSVNNLPLNSGNYNELYNTLSTSQTANLEVIEYTEDGGFSQTHQVTVSKGIVLLQAISSKVLQEGSHTVGYIEIPHFDVGLSRSLLNAFETFKNQSVDEVVVDLRYNGGGDVSSAAALAILLAPDIRGTDQFIRFKGNANGGEVNQSFVEALQTNEEQIGFETLRNAHPAIRRVFIICGNRTASASEIIINNLRPFMNVVTIGEKTVGKDTATFPIEDELTTPGEDHWVLYPAIYKLFNASGEGNYTQGITPSIILDEIAGPELHQLGEPNEQLLQYALSIISGTGRPGYSNNRIRTLKKTRTAGDADPVIINKTGLH